MVYRFGHFVLNPTLRVLYRDGEPVHITAKSFETLLVLIRRRGQVMNKDELMAALWPDTVVEEANLAQSVSTLRKALGDNPAEHRYIATIPGRGYSFVATVMEDSDRAVRSNITQTQSLKAKLLRYPWIFASAGALLLAGVVWVLWRGHGDPAEISQARDLPLTSLAGSEYMPAFSPDGNQVAFVWSGEEGDDPELYVKLTAQGTQLRLTKSSGPVSFPSWSPDGHTIAYAQAAPDATVYFVVSAIGGHRRQIAQIPGKGSGGLDWFADGKRLVISRMPEGVRSSPLVTLDVDSGEQHVLTTRRREVWEI